MVAIQRRRVLYLDVSVHSVCSYIRILSISLLAVISTCTTTQRRLNSIEVFLSVTLYKCTMATESTISILFEDWTITDHCLESSELSVLSSWVNWTFCVWLHSEKSDHPEFHSPCSPKCSMLWVFPLLQFSLMVYCHILHLQKTSQHSPWKPFGSVATILFSSSCVVQKLNISETSPVPSLASKRNSWNIHRTTDLLLKSLLCAFSPPGAKWLSTKSEGSFYDQQEVLPQKTHFDSTRAHFW